jgi:hypothetical protein
LHSESSTKIAGPLEQSNRFELVINARTAKIVGVDLPPTLLARLPTTLSADRSHHVMANTDANTSRATFGDKSRDDRASLSRRQ